jgi:phenylpropionate dioxygenase-like ring-hydroxylating dioxygenase large terminal subunit
MIDTAPLPLSWYFEPEVLEVERRTILASSAEYIACLPAVPEHGSYHTIRHRDDGEVLVRDRDRVRLLSNVCLHRNRLMHEGRGKANAMICPMHRWSYDLSGKLLKAPFYPETPCLALAERPLTQWSGILFAGKRDVARDLAGLANRPDLDVSNYLLTDVQEEVQPVNWKVQIELALENYHAPFTHPGLSRYTSPGTWYDGDGAYDDDLVSYHEMQPHPDFASNPGSRAFEEYQRAALQVNGGRPPHFAALIMVYYPDIILDWYPHMFVATTCVPLTPELTLSTREMYIDPRAIEIVPNYAELAKNAWYEVQRVDDAGHVALHRGRAARYRDDRHARAGHEVYHAMEDCVGVFHRLLMRTAS